MSTTYQHKALIEELKKLSSAKAAENPSEEILDSAHPSAGDSADSDNTTDPVVGSRFAENTQASKEMHPQGPEGGPDNAVGGDGADYGHNSAPSGEGHVPSAKADDPQDPRTAHPAGGKASSVDELLKQATEIGDAIRGLVKGASDIPDAQREFSDDDSATKALPEDNDNITISDEMGSTTASKEGANPAAVVEDLRKSASVDADSFASVCLGIISNYGPVKQAMDEVAEVLAEAEGNEEATAEEEEAEDVLAQMAMADAAPEEGGEAEAAPEEAAPEEAALEEAALEEAALEEALMGGEAEVAPEEAMIEEALMGAPEEAPMGAEEELSPEEQALLMELLASEGMAGEDVEAYGKMSQAIDAGVLNINALPKVQQNYFNSCKVAAHNAATKLRSLKSSAKLSGDLNSIYSREGK